MRVGHQGKGQLLNALPMTTLVYLAFKAATVAGKSDPGASGPQSPTPGQIEGLQKETYMQEHPYVGMWVTDDGQIRHQLLPDGRYDEARGTRESAYQGRYEVDGDHIDYWDDTGFTADGTFVSRDELHHGGMIFRRRASTSDPAE